MLILVNKNLIIKEWIIIKYMGSKARLSKNIAPIINNLIKQNHINTYIEPFVGGANMIEHIICQNKIGSDINEYLIALWKDLQSGWLPPETISKKMYQDVKNNKDKYGKSLVAITGFCATYNAKWFGGYAGVVTTKTGVKRNYYDEAIRNIQKQMLNLTNVKFLCCDYTYYNNYKNCLIYCDIPYKNTTKYGFDKDFNYDNFWNWVRNISRNNIVLISEYNAPNDFECIFEKTLTTTLDKNSRKKNTEKLFIHKNNLNKLDNLN